MGSRWYLTIAQVIRLQLSATQQISWYHTTTVDKISQQVVSDNSTGDHAALVSNTAHQVASYSNFGQDRAAGSIRGQHRSSGCNCKQHRTSGAIVQQLKAILGGRWYLITAQVIRLQLQEMQHIRSHHTATVDNIGQQIVADNSKGD